MFAVNERVRFKNPVPELTAQVGADEAARYGRLAEVIGAEIGVVCDAGQGFMVGDEFVQQCSVLFVEVYGGEVPGAPEALFERYDD